MPSCAKLKTLGGKLLTKLGKLAATCCGGTDTGCCQMLLNVNISGTPASPIFTFWPIGGNGGCAPGTCVVNGHCTTHQGFYDAFNQIYADPDTGLVTSVDLELTLCTPNACTQDGDCPATYTTEQTVAYRPTPAEMLAQFDVGVALNMIGNPAGWYE